MKKKFPSFTHVVVDSTETSSCSVFSTVVVDVVDTGTAATSSLANAEASAANALNDVSR